MGQQREDGSVAEFHLGERRWDQGKAANCIWYLNL